MNGLRNDDDCYENENPFYNPEQWAEDERLERIAKTKRLEEKRKREEMAHKRSESMAIWVEREKARLCLSKKNNKFWSKSL